MPIQGGELGVVILLSVVGGAIALIVGLLVDGKEKRKHDEHD